MKNKIKKANKGLREYTTYSIGLRSNPAYGDIYNLFGERFRVVGFELNKQKNRWNVHLERITNKYSFSVYKFRNTIEKSE